MKLKISPSQLEQWRLCYLGKYGKTDADFIHYLTSQFEKTDAMSLGSAFHEVLENGPEKYVQPDGWLKVFERDLGKFWYFNPECGQAAIEFRKQYANMFHEVKGQLSWSAGGYEIVSNMKVDGIHGVYIHEMKTSKSKRGTADQDYFDSMQWRMYLLKFPEIKSVIYTKFLFDDVEGKLNYISFRGIEQFEMVRNENMYAEIQDWACEMISYLSNNNLLDLIKYNETAANSN
jgi:hypothetical protein